MENRHEKQKRQAGGTQSAPSALYAAVFAAVLLAGATAFLLRPDKPGRSAAELPLPVETPLPTEAPAATPLPPEETPAPKYPAGAVDVFYNGTLLFTYESRSAARALFTEYLAGRCDAEGGYLIGASYSGEISTRTASGEGEYVTKEEALSRLPSIVSIRRVTGRNTAKETVLPASVTEADYLPAGTRLVRYAPKNEITVTHVETIDENGTVTDTNENSFIVGSGASGAVIELGTGAGAFEGSAETAPRLHAPVKGTAVRPFGPSETGLSNGIDYLSETGYSVYAPGSGTVIYCGVRGHLGFVIEIEHEKSGYVSRLSGVSAVTVSLGDEVQKGDCLGVMPALPAKAKPMLRYELLYLGIPIDPALYLK